MAFSAVSLCFAAKCYYFVIHTVWHLNLNLLCLCSPPFSPVVSERHQTMKLSFNTAGCLARRCKLNYVCPSRLLCVILFCFVLQVAADQSSFSNCAACFARLHSTLLAPPCLSLCYLVLCCIWSLLVTPTNSFHKCAGSVARCGTQPEDDRGVQAGSQSVCGGPHR